MKIPGITIFEKNMKATFQPLHVMVLILRIVLGGLMLEAGLNKLISGDFTISGDVSHGSGPFAGWFTHFASVSGVLSPLVVWGEILIGIALIFGIFLRFEAFGGALLMVLYYLPYLPPQNGWISQQIIYLLVFIMLIFSGSGYFLGVDRLVKPLEERSPSLRFILG